MDSRYTSEEFYPYREQQKHGRDEIPVVESLEHHHEFHAKQTKRRPGWLAVAILGFFLLFGGVVLYNRQARERQLARLALTPTTTPTPTPSPTVTPTPTLRVPQFPDAVLQAAYEKTTAARTMRAGFRSDVRTTYVREDGSEQIIESLAEGYLFGTTDGETIQTELRVTQKDDPSRAAFFGQILVNDQLFMKTDSNNWVLRNRSDYNKLYENRPIDATAYAYNLLDTLFTQSRAFLRGIDEGSVTREADAQIEGKPAQVFRFALSIPLYLEALERDPKTADFTLTDARKILADSNISGQLFVDAETGYIIRIQAQAGNLSQISTIESRELGVRAFHSMSMVANLLDFDMPISLAAPI